MADDRRTFAAFMAGVALLSVLAMVNITATRRTALVSFPQTDLDMINVMQSLNGKRVRMEKMSTAQPAQKHSHAKKLSMPQQYARIMQNMGYFAPWSRQNSWEDRIAIANIRKNNSPQALAAKAAKIEAENKKFQKRFSTPHTSQYTGVHEKISNILDPKYQPWANAAPRKAYYQGY
ncbi:hypothetical protein GUITHDRAFT_160420 [Guillardia theta CCMP2712]|uniref:Uncharacterized protein n=1 Tax=Guillardia theta (strain CCMP2712) TaxID=905079 RepID=L1K4A4_GUITC|nr:hypothetical protein GUITHDRAFT_160420 [Guillardia theta CCMP2712]EKX55275.1 hypothetical protein GUITHDRAFT_160420 [Guillardia theta CCMP2712]|eukprot:XP_005842255.1 hypothetical protein GUITHDRAFT_160420 [Guillardia theta CCMP2712]